MSDGYSLKETWREKQTALHRAKNWRGYGLKVIVRHVGCLWGVYVRKLEVK